MTLSTEHDQMIQVTAYEWADKPRFYDTFEDALIATTIEFGRAMWRKKNYWTHRDDTSIQYGTDNDWVAFKVVQQVKCECGKSFKTRKGYNTHRGARGNCPRMSKPETGR